jgi:hypothetical protein
VAEAWCRVTGQLDRRRKGGELWAINCPLLINNRRLLIDGSDIYNLFQSMRITQQFILHSSLNRL